MSDRPEIRVVAAAIERGGRYLIAQRLPKAVFAGYWEFPGGKVEPGEDDPTALVREIREELDAAIDVGPQLAREVHEYPEFTLDFRVYRCSLIGDRAEKVNVADIRWVTVEEMAGYRFPPADEQAIALLTRDLAESR